jgi:hypothetical protein
VIRVLLVNLGAKEQKESPVYREMPSKGSRDLRGIKETKEIRE